VLALVLISALLGSATAANIVKLAEANPYPYTHCDSSFVTVSVISPENKTYSTNNIQVTITAGAYPGVWFVWYSVDGGSFIEVAPGHPLGHTFSESLSLNRLSRGSHNIVAKAIAIASDNPEGIVTAYSQVDFTITNVVDPDLQIMSFEQAIEAANTGNDSGEHVSSYSLTGEPAGEPFVDETGVSGFLMWLAPNGIFYEAEYPTGTALSEIGHTLEALDLNPPNGYYLWDLYFGEGLWREEYWIFANNGTIALYNPPRGGGPTSAPPPFPQEIIDGTVVAVLIAIVGIGLLVYFKKRRR
jgi:hypothetical protein